MTTTPIKSGGRDARSAPATRSAGPFRTSTGRNPTKLLARIRRTADVIRMTVADLRDAWRAGGASAFGREFRESVQFRLFRHGELLVIEHALDHVEHPPPPDGVRVSVCERPEEWDALVAVVNRRTADRLRRAAEAGRICLVAWRESRPVGYTWLSPRIDVDIETFPIPLPDDALYGWNLWVAPEARRSGIGSALTSARLEHSRRLGYRIGWRAIDAGNRGSVGTVRNTAGDGTRVVGHLRYVKLLGWTRGRMTPEPGGPEAGTARFQ